MGDRTRLERYFEDLAAAAGTAPLTDEEAGELLDLARVVAHTVERKYAPLATYAAGLGLDLGLTPGERAARIRAVRDTVQRRSDAAADAG